MSFLGKQKPRYKRGNRNNNNRQQQQTHVPTTDSLRTLFLTHLPPSYTNTNSLFQSQKNVGDLIAKYIGPNNVLKIKIIGEGRVKVVFKMAIWAKKLKKLLQGVKLRNHEDWLQWQQRQKDKEEQEDLEFEIDQELRDAEKLKNANFNEQVQDIVPLTKDHFRASEIEQLKKDKLKRKISTTRGHPSNQDKKQPDLAEMEYEIKIVDHEEKLQNAQQRHRNRDVVVKCIPDKLTLKEAEKKLHSWLGSIGVITNIRIPARHGSIQEHTGYAFVSFKRPKHAEMAIEKKNGRRFEGVKLVIEERLNRDEYVKEKERREAMEAAGEQAPPQNLVQPEKPVEKEEPVLNREQKISMLKARISTTKDAKEVKQQRKQAALNEKLSKFKAKAMHDAQDDDSSDSSDSSSSDSSSDSSSEAESVHGFDTDSEDEGDGMLLDSDEDKPIYKRRDSKKAALKAIPSAHSTVQQEEEPDISKEKSDEISRTVFVRNIPVGATENDVILIFSTYGIVEDCKLVINRKTGVPTGTGFILYQNKSSFNKLFSSVKLANSMTLAEQKGEDRLSLEEFKKSIAHLSETQQKKQLKGYLRETSMEKRRQKEERKLNNFWESDELQLDGSPLYIAKAVPKKVARDKMINAALETAKDKRNLHLATEGFIPRGSTSALGIPDKLLDKLEEKHIEKQQKLRSDTSLHINDRRLKVSYIPKTWRRTKLQNVFATAVKKETNRFPKIVQTIILKDEKGKSKGMGFVEFTKHEQALIALRELNNNPNVYEGGRLYIEFAVDNLRKLHNAHYKKTHVAPREMGATSNSRIQRIHNKVEDAEVLDRINRVMDTSRPGQKRKRQFQQQQHKQQRAGGRKRRRM